MPDGRDRNACLDAAAAGFDIAASAADDTVVWHNSAPASAATQQELRIADFTVTKGMRGDIKTW
jgi:hypothetical protein